MGIIGRLWNRFDFGINGRPIISADRADYLWIKTTLDKTDIRQQKVFDIDQMCAQFLSYRNFMLTIHLFLNLQLLDIIIYSSCVETARFKWEKRICRVEPVLGMDN